VTVNTANGAIGSGDSFTLDLDNNTISESLPSTSGPPSGGAAGGPAGGRPPKGRAPAHKPRPKGR
jgi:hypothetical protein